MAIQTPYLDAIQGIPGGTLSEKFQWIAKLTKDRLRECNSLEEVAEAEKIPKPLAPLVQVQAALILNKKDRMNQKSYEAIAEALKSNDEMIVNKAFESSSFFDGTNKTITSVQYFFENLFPFVSLKTRTRIIKALASHLAHKDSDLAECFFTAVTMTYGLQQALPLLLACSENFVYNTIVEKRIVLSRKQVKDMFRKNPDFVVRYFRLSKRNNDPYQRDLHRVDMYEFGDFLAALIKKRLEAFVELYEMHKDSPPSVNLSNKCAESFLKNGKEHLQRNPKLYIKILPLKLISANRMESIFAKLFPENVKQFKIDEMLRYLKFYPQEKKADLFLRTYRQVYGKNLLESSSNVTHMLLKILPPEERIKQARIKLAVETAPTRTMIYSCCWKCYLPTEESIPAFKEEISKTPEMENRAVILCEMIFCCKVNNDDHTLLEVLKYIRDRHKNEQYWVTLKVFECLEEEYDLSQLSEDHWAVLMDIILRVHVKKELPAGNTISEGIVEAALHFKIIHNQPIDQVIDILIDMKSTRYTTSWNVLKKYPEYERMCLEACFMAISQKFHSDNGPWSTDRPGVLYDLCYSIYRFNEDHVNKNTRIERISIKNYPWLLEKMSEFLSKKEEVNHYIIHCFKCLLQTNEKDLHDRFWPPKGEKIAEFQSGEALKLLRKNPESILNRWKEYLDACKRNWYNAQTKRFLKATRWYKDIPVKFAEQCLQDLANENDDGSLSILAALVHGETFVKAIEPLIPISKTVDIHQKEAKMNYFQVIRMISASKILNPPLPLQLVNKLLEGDYLSVALITLTNTCRRTSSIDVISFARTLTSQRVSVRKHGIRVMCMVAPRDYLQQFLLSKWESEKHYSIREVLFSKAKQLFSNEPDQDTWTMFSRMVATLMVEDQSVISEIIKMLDDVPNEYVSDLVKLILSTVDRYSEVGLPAKQLNSDIATLLRRIDAAICKLLPEDFIEQLLRRFLFHPDTDISASATEFMIDAYLFPAKEELDKRMQVFSNIFAETVRTGWNIPHPKKPLFYPVNNQVGKFINKLVETTYSEKTSPQLIDGILKTFLSVLTPQMDPTSYLLLVFAKEYGSVKEPKELGVRIGRTMSGLVDIFSSVFIFFMSSVLNVMIETRGFEGRERDDTNLSVIEGLMEVGSTEAMLMAVRLLKPVNNDDYWRRYNNLVLKFTECDHPAVKSIICDILNKTYYDCSS